MLIRIVALWTLLLSAVVGLRAADYHVDSVGGEGNNIGAHCPIDPGVYGKDVAEISRRMKAVDLSILIGDNELHTDSWMKLLDQAAADIDSLVVHLYPFYGWESYDDYLHKNPDACKCVRWAKAAIEAHPIARERKPKILVTEYAAGAYNAWDQAGADVSREVMTVDMLGQLLQNPDVYMALFWNTINIYEGDGSVFNALI